MKKPLTYLLLFILPLGLFAQQGNPKIKIDTNPVSADPLSGLKLPAWLKAGQTLAADQEVYSISVIEFTINGTIMDFSQVLNVTTVQTVPAGKVWKVESLYFDKSSNSSVNWSLLGNAGTTVGTNFLGTSDNTDLALKTNGVEHVRVSSTGNVGIGTTAPASKLDVNGSVKITDGTQAAGRLLTSNATGVASWDGLGPEYVAMLVRDVAPATSEGNAVAGAWTIRPLNLESFDPKNIVTLNGSNQFTLAAGTYMVEANQVYYSDGGVQMQFRGRIRNVSDNVTIATSLTSRLHVLSGNSGNNFCDIPPTYFTLASNKTFELQYHSQSTGGATGLGSAAGINTGEMERYAYVVITKIK